MRNFSPRLLIGTCFLALGFGPALASETLDGAIASAFATNPQLEIERYRTEIARENLNLARSQGRPAVTLSASGGYEYLETTNPFAFGLGDRPIASAQIQAVQPLYTGGRISSSIRQAEAGLDSADLSFIAATQDLTLQVVTAYVNVRRDREAVTIRRNNVDVSAEQVRAAQDRFDVGVVTRTDVALARARFEGAQAALAGAEAALRGSEATYELLTGLAPGDLAPPPPVPPLPSTLEAAISEALAENPDIASARQDLRGAAAAVDTARADGRPQVNLIGTTAVQETFGDRNQRDSSVSALAQARIPILTGGAVRAQVDAAKLRRAQAQRLIDSLEMRIRAQVTQAWFAYDAASRSIEASRRQVEAAEIAYEGAKEELAVGVRSTLDVLDQEQQLFEARLAVISAERDAYVAAHNLLRATGGLANRG
jgi:outer membrane protein